MNFGLSEARSLRVSLGGPGPSPLAPFQGPRRGAHELERHAAGRLVVVSAGRRLIPRADLNRGRASRDFGKSGPGPQSRPRPWASRGRARPAAGSGLRSCAHSARAPLPAWHPRCPARPFMVRAIIMPCSWGNKGHTGPGAPGPATAASRQVPTLPVTPSAPQWAATVRWVRLLVISGCATSSNSITTLSAAS